MVRALLTAGGSLSAFASRMLTCQHLSYELVFETARPDRGYDRIRGTPEELPACARAGYNAASVLVPAAANTSAVSFSAMGIKACTTAGSNCDPELLSNRETASRCSSPLR